MIAYARWPIGAVALCAVAATSPGAGAGPKTSGGTYDASPLPIPILDTSRLPSTAPAPVMPARVMAPSATPAPTRAAPQLWPPAFYPPPVTPIPAAAPAPVLTPPPAAPGPTKTVTPLSVDYAKSYANTVIDLVKSPSTADTGTLVVGGLVLGAIAGATALDANVKRYTQRHRNVSSNKTADVVRPFGEPMLLAGGSALAYAGGLALGDRKLQETGLLSVESLLISAGLTEGIKRAAGRQRPNQTDDQYKFDGIGGKGKSFPSGHTSHAFSVASVLAEQYDETRYVPALSYAITGLTGLSRINDNKHWLSDTMFSAALGYVVGKITVKNSVFREATGLSILPYSDGRDVGINLGMKF